MASALFAVAALLAPRAAWAGAAACDARAISVAPDVVAMCVALAQAGVELPDEVAGLCDPSGASAIAPPPSMPVESGTIGAADDCRGAAIRGAAVSSSSEEKTSRDASVHLDPASLGGVRVAIRPSTADVHELIARDASPTRDFVHEIERPPRR